MSSPMLFRKYTSARAMIIHFRDRDVGDTIFFAQEDHFPRCARCGIFSKTVGMRSHQAKKMCKDANERQKKQKVAKGHQQMKKDLVFKEQADRDC